MSTWLRMPWDAVQHFRQNPIQTLTLVLGEHDPKWRDTFDQLKVKCPTLTCGHISIMEMADRVQMRPKAAVHTEVDAIIKKYVSLQRKFSYSHESWIKSSFAWALARG